MGEDRTGPDTRPGEDAAEAQNTAAEALPASGWVTTDVAAAGLSVSPRTVRDYISAGRLEAKPEGEGVERRWLVSIDSIQALRESRRAAGVSPRSRREGSRGGEDAAANAEMIAALQELQYRLGRAEARAELTERAESTLREERDRLLSERDEAQVEARRLREELEAEKSRGFWSRLFGG